MVPTIVSLQCYAKVRLAQDAAAGEVIPAGPLQHGIRDPGSIRRCNLSIAGSAPLAARTLEVPAH